MAQVPDVLYIEDERHTLDLIIQLLETAGFPVRGVTSGEAGLAELRRQKPDLLLLDLMMPGISGWEVYRAMKQDPVLATVPVIVITAAHDAARSAKEIGAADYLGKPFELRALRSLVEKSLARATASAHV